MKSWSLAGKTRVQNLCSVADGHCHMTLTLQQVERGAGDLLLVPLGMAGRHALVSAALPDGRPEAERGGVGEE